MNFKPRTGLLGPKHLPVERTTSNLLREAVDAFSANPGKAIKAIQGLQSSDASGLTPAALQMLISAEEKSHELKHVAGLLTAANLLAGLFLNVHLPPLDAAVPLARKVTWAEPLLDVRLIRQLVANAAGTVSAVKPGEALHALALVDAISDCTRLGAHLIQFLNHPSDKVRSKAALMLGRSNWNLTRVESLLASDDSRLRANAVESLWGQRQADVRKILWGATEDPSGRVVVNALLGLCRHGDREAYAGLTELAKTSDPLLRSGAAWAMGETGDPEFAEALETLAGDCDDKVKAMAGKSQKKLRRPDPVSSPPPVDGAAHGSSSIESTRSSDLAKPGWLSGSGRKA